MFISKSRGYSTNTDKRRRCSHIVRVCRNYSILVFVPTEAANGVLLQVHVDGERIAADYHRDGIARSSDQWHSQTAIEIVRSSIINLFEIIR